MAYKTLLVHCELGRPNAGLLRIAGDLASRFGAGVIGIAMCQPMQIVYSDGPVPGDLIQQDRRQRESEIAAAEAEFRAALTTHVANVEWRSDVTNEPLADYLARQSRCADLIVTGVDQNASVFDMSRHLNIGDFVMQTGRPVLVVPTTADKIGLEHVLVGWKDTRETRRTVMDALPLLRQAAVVSVVEIAPEDEMEAVRARLADVATWLERHGVHAEPVAKSSAGEDAHQLHSLALQFGADLIVAGAYGHSRVREWVFGGVTRDLLLRPRACALVAH